MLFVEGLDVVVDFGFVGGGEGGVGDGFPERDEVLEEEVGELLKGNEFAAAFGVFEFEFVGFFFDEQCSLS